jgi:hypothetical protein
VLTDSAVKEPVFVSLRQIPVALGYDNLKICFAAELIHNRCTGLVEISVAYSMSDHLFEWKKSSSTHLEDP